MNVRAEMIPIETTPIEEPDPDWVQECSAGHEHRWAKGGVTDTGLVVLAPATEEHLMIAEFVCLTTSETITPRYRSPQYRTYVAGPQHFFIDEEEVSQEAYEAAVKEARP